ncbi:uncharacterized protein METZ01_LOCUS432079 [marine metagenome]|uniref:Uncharacterized protein n=1 Tax=marine metagenome TaxID=408172 RepID=A0A382Y8N6_9ZZZZ
MGTPTSPVAVHSSSHKKDAPEDSRSVQSHLQTRVQQEGGAMS